MDSVNSVTAQVFVIDDDLDLSRYVKLVLSKFNIYFGRVVFFADLAFRLGQSLVDFPSACCLEMTDLKRTQLGL
jgi:hypothetical protein